MHVLIPTESRLFRTPDGAVWTKGTNDNGYWQRYLSVFDEINIVARVLNVTEAPPSSYRVDGEGVSIAPIPYYVGPLQYISKQFKVRASIRAIAHSHPYDAVIVRAPGRMATLMYEEVRRERRPYGVEVVGDPHDVMAPGTTRHPLRAYFRWSMTRSLRTIVSGADAVSYVTADSLQARYPVSEGAFSTSYSSIELWPDAILDKPRVINQPISEPNLVFVGSLEMIHKGLDVLLDAMVVMKRSGVTAHLSVLGDGRLRSEFESYSVTNGLQGSVRFLGSVAPGSEVREYLAAADMFVMPTRGEGLPRAMIEAMAQGMPCIGSKIGGIPELLPEEDLVPVNQPRALAEKLIAVAGNPTRLTAMSERNLKKAKEYRADILQAKREQLYIHLRDQTLMQLKLDHT